MDEHENPKQTQPDVGHGKGLACPQESACELCYPAYLEMLEYHY